MRKILLSFLVALFTSAAVAENLVVIAATEVGDELLPGSIVQSDAVLKLRDGGSLTLLSKSGVVIQLVGPFSGFAAKQNTSNDAENIKPWASTLSSIAELVKKNVERSNVVGSSRNTDTPLNDTQNDAWLLTVDSSGHRCLSTTGADLWRKKSDSSVKMDLRSQSTQQKGMIWRAGENRIELPQKFIEDGTLVVMKIDSQPRRFNIHVLPQEIDANQWGRVLHWMVASKCNRQAAVVVDGLHSGKIKSQ